MKFNIIKNSKIWIILSLIGMFVFSLLFFFNLRFSIEFTGGIEIKIQTNNIQENDRLKKDLENFLKNNGYEKIGVSISKENLYTNILFKVLLYKDEQIEKLSNLIQNFLLEKEYIKTKDQILSMSIIGPSIGEYMKSSAIQAIIWGVIFMAIYIIFSFSGLRQFVSPLNLAIITLFTTFFDIIMPAGAYGVLMYFNQTIQVNTIFIIAIMTVIGYSINDTIIIFDRIRENFKLYETKINQGKFTYQELFEKSIWQTMRRSIGTSLTTFLVVFGMYIFGSGVLKLFAFTLGIGILFGSFSSIFLSVPLAYVLSGKYNQEKNF